MVTQHFTSLLQKVISIVSNGTPNHPRKHRDWDSFNSLIESSVDLNIKNSNGYTSLHLAVTYRQSDVIKALIASGANLETKNNNHKTPYDDSVSLGYKDIQSLLKKAIVCYL